jgi:VanZ family protein
VGGRPVIGLWLPVAVCMAAMYYGAAAAMPPTAPIANWLTDTALHVGGYLLLSILTLRAVAGARWRAVTPRTLLLAAAISMLHGLSVEWMQMYLPTRFAEWRDVWNDAAGTALGLGPAWAWSIMRRQSA